VRSTVQIVVPCYNEAGRLDRDAFLRALDADAGLAFLFVDDGSTDGTRALLDQLATRGGGRIGVMTLARNAGKAHAVQAGLLAALEQGAAFVGYWDADLAAPLGAISDFMAVFHDRPDVEIVMGSRVKLLGREVSRSPARHYSGRVFATVASLALGISVYDTQCGAKLFRVTERVSAIFRAPFQSRWVFDVEILSRYVAAVGRSAAEARIYEVPLLRWTAVAGSKLTPRHALRALWDLAMIARRPS
jgi:dolichyl-phosphate beta-glucosyltransferase